MEEKEVNNGWSQYSLRTVTASGHCSFCCLFHPVSCRIQHHHCHRSGAADRPQQLPAAAICHPAGLAGLPLLSILVILRRSRHICFGCGGSVFAAHRTIPLPQAMLTMMGTRGGDKEIWRGRVTAADQLSQRCREGTEAMGDVDDDGYTQWRQRNLVLEAHHG
jgi:hypothetical protein